MKATFVAGSFALLVACSMPAFAGDGEKKAEKGPRGDVRKQVIEKFDADGDGKLNEKERAAAKKAFAERRGSGARPGGGLVLCRALS